MPNLNLTDVTVLIDSSTSMGELRDSVVAGVNGFLATQSATARKLKKHCDVQLIQFNDTYEPGARWEVSKHPGLKLEQFEPRGQTALLDSIGLTMDDAGRRFAALPENERPGKVIFVILTDGADDASKHYTQSDIREKIALQTSTYQWDVIYLGANQDAWVVGRNFGLLPGKTLSTEANHAGTEQGFAIAADYVARALEAKDARTAIENRFTDDDARRVRLASNSHAEARI